jgi:transketolase N-terminal domain/subunit
LGSGLPIAVGRAIGNPNRKVYVTISDGECAEGSVWESLRFIDENNVNNIKVYANINGFAAYKSVDIDKLSNRLKLFLPDINLRFTDVHDIIEFKTSLAAHYQTANNEMKLKLK